MSSTRTMKPTIPPPAPYCVALELEVVRGAAWHRAARQIWRRMLNIVSVKVLERESFDVSVRFYRLLSSTEQQVRQQD